MRHRHLCALGTKPNPIIGQATPGLDLNRLGNIVADDDTQCTNLPGIFAGGDIVTGGATVILAMGAGRRAAKAIAAWLQMGKVKWPVTTEDAEAFIPGAAVGSLVPPSPAVDAAAQEQVATTASS